MRIYVGQTRGGWALEEARSQGWGEMTVRGELPPRRQPWAFDNGAYRDWRKGREFNTERFVKDLACIAGLPAPDFIVAPDVVAGGAASLEFSLSWLPRLRELGHPVYLAIQDGMGKDLPYGEVDGLFVGGTRDWKLATGAAWVKRAHDHGLPCHIGRAGGIKSARWALRIGADSLDSCLPLFSRENFDRFVRALKGAQLELFT